MMLWKKNSGRDLKLQTVSEMLFDNLEDLRLKASSLRFYNPRISC